MQPHTAFQADIVPPRPSAAGGVSGESDAALASRIRAGDETAFSELFTLYCRPLCDFARSYVHCPETAAEIVQELFLRIWSHRSTWRVDDGIRPYLFMSCRNAALNHRKHDSVVTRVTDQVQRERLAPALGAAPRRPDEDSEASEIAAAVRAAVHGLAERRRLVVILRWEHHLSHAEIAAILGISVRGVETQFARAMVSLRRQLGSFRS
ncbi:MAG: polymerase sigma-70 factor [Gemmatimonadetes bacterium]|jgi:RNA polymerase sigma-70 factor (ECF subfamily)|nr:polymerase sigma-70 factor [Gemmatimonadota bacterium]